MALTFNTDVVVDNAHILSVTKIADRSGTVGEQGSVLFAETSDGKLGYGKFKRIDKTSSSAKRININMTSAGHHMLIIMGANNTEGAIVFVTCNTDLTTHAWVIGGSSSVTVYQEATTAGRVTLQFGSANVNYIITDLVLMGTEYIS